MRKRVCLRTRRCCLGRKRYRSKRTYAPHWVDGKTKQFIVYAKTRDECEEKLQETIAQAKAELEKLKKKHPKPEDKKKEIKIMV